MTINRAYTKEEAKAHFLKKVRDVAEHWATLPNKTEIERCNGVAFSILNIIDGNTEFPIVDLTLRVHGKDKEACLEESENFYQNGMVFNNDCYLHEEYYEQSENKLDKLTEFLEDNGFYNVK